MAHQPLQFGEDPETPARVPVPPLDPAIKPVNIDLQRDTALTIRWSDGRESVYPIDLLRRESPSAEARAVREELAGNPLAVLPASAVSAGPLTAETAELVGHYALRIRFSDGHDTGLYTWAFLRHLDPAAPAPDDKAP